MVAQYWLVQKCRFNGCPELISAKRSIYLLPGAGGGGGGRAVGWGRTERKKYWLPGES